MKMSRQREAQSYAALAVAVGVAFVGMCQASQQHRPHRQLLIKFVDRAEGLVTLFATRPKLVNQYAVEDENSI